MEIRPHLNLANSTPLKVFPKIGTIFSRCECVCCSVLNSGMCENMDSTTNRYMPNIIIKDI